MKFFKVGSVFVLASFLFACSSTSTTSQDNSIVSNRTTKVNCASLGKEEWAKCESDKMDTLEREDKANNWNERLDEFVKPIKK